MRRGLYTVANYVIIINIRADFHICVLNDVYKKYGTIGS